jgi:predicted transcriptional regulator
MIDIRHHTVVFKKTACDSKSLLKFPQMRSDRLGRFEFELVEYISEHPGPVRAIVANYAEKKGITRGSIVKSLDRLVKKGVVGRHLDGGIFNYSVEQSSAELQESAIQGFVDAHLRGRVSPIAAYLMKDKRISDEDAKSIQAILHKLAAQEPSGD